MSIYGLKPKIGAILTSDFSIFRLNFPFLPQCAMLNETLSMIFGHCACMLLSALVFSSCFCVSNEGNHILFSDTRKFSCQH